VAEVLLLLAAIAVPLLIGVAIAYFVRPWWWGALVSVAVFPVAAIAPEPRKGKLVSAVAARGSLQGELSSHNEGLALQVESCSP
jgi:hypothetical protein